MAIVNFSVPDAVKTAFDKTFKGQNKSAIIARCMQRAIEETKQSQRREELFRLLTKRRAERPVVTARALRNARTAGRP